MKLLLKFALEKNQEIRFEEKKFHNFLTESSHFLWKDVIRIGLRNFPLSNLPVVLSPDRMFTYSEELSIVGLEPPVIQRVFSSMTILDAYCLEVVI